MTATSGISVTIVRVASMPLMRSMLMSMSTRSGLRLGTTLTASSPELASPTTSNPGVTFTTAPAASRNGRWSSTIKTETPPVSPLSIGSILSVHRLDG